MQHDGELIANSPSRRPERSPESFHLLRHGCLEFLPEDKIRSPLHLRTTWANLGVRSDDFDLQYSQVIICLKFVNVEDQESTLIRVR